jgi:hypothetical protein
MPLLAMAVLYMAIHVMLHGGSCCPFLLQLTMAELKGRHMEVLLCALVGVHVVPQAFTKPAAVAA